MLPIIILKVSKGAQAIAMAVFLARKGNSKDQIKDFISSAFDYDLNREVGKIREHYTFDVSCQGSVPEAIICFLESTDFEDAIRTAISIGGDSDTIACMAGAIAQAFIQKFLKCSSMKPVEDFQLTFGKSLINLRKNM